jgi:hypothetical protein
MVFMLFEQIFGFGKEFCGGFIGEVVPWPNWVEMQAVGNCFNGT